MLGHHVSRRSLLRATAALGGLAIAANMLGPISSAAADEGVASFTHLSEFLTGHKLDPVLGARFFAALKKRDADLDASLAALSQPDPTVRRAGHGRFPGSDRHRSGIDADCYKGGIRLVSRCRW
ncbi:sugar dehydrogenase complex small subunit [Rhizobium sp. AN83]|uniref:sugar dehydrogenase complex small subunit n=1 Tax=Rhizobium sp. AN83 TaxID=3035217 RepID=UPI003A5988AD